MREESFTVRAVGPAAAGASYEPVVQVLQDDGDGAEDAVCRVQHEGVVSEIPAARCQVCIRRELGYDMGPRLRELSASRDSHNLRSVQTAPNHRLTAHGNSSSAAALPPTILEEVLRDDGPLMPHSMDREGGLHCPMRRLHKRL